jgi:8-oxo-dGTP pyrophosphatase MutT (NUDIX family)
MERPTFKNKGNEEVQLPDGRTVWLSRSPAVVAVILGIHKDNIFVLTEKRAETMQDEPGKWALVSGYLDFNETGWEGVCRETYEETSFDVRKYENNLIFDNDKQPWFVNTDPKENRQNISLSYIMIYDFTRALPEDVESYKDSEISEVKWLPIEHVISGNREWAFGHQYRIFNAIEKFKVYLI